MADDDDAVVEFCCCRCRQELSAPKSKVGTKGLCPRCQLAYEVPVKSTLRVGEEYVVVEGGGPSAAELETFVSVTCHKCRTHMQAKEDQIGREIVCPDCGTRLAVPVPEAEEPVEEKPPEPGDVYGLREGPARAEASGEASSETPAAEEPKYFPVHCSLCNTLMHVTADQAGEKITCPDCRTVTQVKLTKEEARLDSAAFRVGADEEYGFKKGADQPSVGSELRDSKPEKGGEESEGGGAVPKPAEKPQFQPGIDYRTGRPRDEEEPPEIVQVPEPPSRPLTEGVFDFPLLPQVRIRSLILAAGVLPALLLLSSGYVHSTAADRGDFSIETSLKGMFLMVVGFSVLLAWAAVMAVHFFAIVTDISRGDDEIKSWPKGVSVELIRNSIFVLGAFVMSAAPGVVLSQPLFMVGVPAWCRLLAVVTFWLIFPFVLLSIIEENSVFSPFSEKVWATVSGRWWRLFYAETAGLLVAGVGLLWVAVWLKKPAIWGAKLIGLWSLAEKVLYVLWYAFAAAVLVYVLMVYARLLGRLTWVCLAEVAAGSKKRSPGNPS